MIAPQVWHVGIFNAWWQRWRGEGDPRVASLNESFMNAEMARDLIAGLPQCPSLQTLLYDFGAGAAWLLFRLVARLTHA